MMVLEEVVLEVQVDPEVQADLAAEVLTAPKTVPTVLKNVEDLAVLVDPEDLEVQEVPVALILTMILGIVVQEDPEVQGDPEVQVDQEVFPVIQIQITLLLTQVLMMMIALTSLYSQGRSQSLFPTPSREYCYLKEFDTSLSMFSSTQTSQ